MALIEVNNVALANVANYTVGWYDVSLDSGRDTTTADGTMILNVISQKYRLDITTTYMNETELKAFYAQISQAPTMSVTFFNPYTGTNDTKTMYRGDRTTQLRWAKSNAESDIMFEPNTIALIQL